MGYGESELVAQAAVSARPSPSGWWRAKCPMCLLRVGKPDRRGSLAINVTQGYYHCHRCGAHGRFVVGDMVQARAAKHPAAVPDSALPFRPPEGFSVITEWPAATSFAFAPARAYLARRKVSKELQAKLHIGASARGKFAGRVIVPILDDKGAWLGYVGRSWNANAMLPYLYPAGMKKGEILYNRAALMVETDEPVFIVEGVFDAIALWPHGVAVFGKLTTRSPYMDEHYATSRITEAQIDALVGARRPVAIVPDGDAWEEGSMLALRLRFEGQRAGFVRLPPQTDPDEVDAGWLREEARACLSA